ncbi:MAG TPA: hypothetical protein VGM29_09685 [Polyangiaceae bacterium]|jgi:hypothetical protein
MSAACSLMFDEDTSALWHVAFSTEDVRVWSLDQLNDAFRFDVVTAATLVQKHGSQGWQRLGVMAGIEPDGTPADTAAPSPQAVARALREAGIAAQGSIPAPAPTSYAPPPFAPAPASFAPAPFSTIAETSALTSAPSRRPRPMGGWLLAAAVLGFFPVLYRNDLLLAAAQRAGRESQYLSLEKQYLGGPAYGTPRQLDGQFPTPPATASTADSSALVPSPSSGASPAPASGTPKPSAPAVSAAPAVGATPAAAHAVSLDALPVETPQSAAAVSHPAAASVARAPSNPVRAASPSPEERPAKRAAPPPPKEEVPTDPLKAAIFTAVKKEAQKK